MIRNLIQDITTMNGEHDSPEKFVKIAKEHKWRLKDKRFQRQGEGDPLFVGEVDQSQNKLMASEQD